MTTTRILIVEDEAIVARDLNRQLARLGYDTVADTPRGEEAIVLVGQLRPHLVLMDIHLAGPMDGIEAATAIREQLDTPVVFLTAFADDAILQRSKLAEPFGYIVKPFDERELHSVIEIALTKHQAEQRLRQSREELAIILRTALDGFWLVDGGGRLLDVNDAACAMLGYSREELLRLTIGEIEARETNAEITAHLALMCRNGADRFETRHRCKDGRVIDVEISVTYLPGDSGRFVAFLRDITARKRADAESEAITHLLQLANTPSGLREFLQTAMTLLRDWSGCESVGLRLREDDDCPYLELGANGLLVEKARQLCHCDDHGQVLLDPAGAPVGDCLCGRLLRGEFDPALPCFTARGSYWNNAATDVLAGSVPLPAAHNHRRTRIPEAVALVPLRLGPTPLGLLEFNSARSQAFDPARIALFEHLADNLAIAIAQRQSQAALLASEQRFRLLLESTSDYTYSTRQTAEGAVDTRHGAGCLKVTGFTAAEFDHRPRLWLEMVPPEDRNCVEAFALRLTAGEQPEPIEHRIVHRDGSIRWVHNSAVVRRSPEGETLQDGVITDITGRKRAEEALRASESKFATVFRCAPLMIAISNLDDGVFLEVNDELVRATGFTRAELIGRSSVELGLISSHDRARTVEAVRRDTRITALPLALVAKGGRKLDCLFSAEAVDIAGGPRLLSIALDLTAHKHLEAQLRQAQKMDAFGQLAGGVAHDFNNILVAITLHVGLLRQSEYLDPETKASLRELEQEAARGAGLTRQLLAFSRQRPLEMQPLDLNETVANLLKMLRRILGERIVVEWIAARNLPPVDGDVGTLEQVLMNLCVNARDAMAGTGRITLRTALVDLAPALAAERPGTRPGRHVRLSVSDTGCGMDAATRARIFEPFFTTKDVGQGTGLGLSIVHGIVQQHGGWIEVESAVGQGSTFHVLLPALTARLAPPPAPAVAMPLGRGELVLAVEDEESVRTIYTTTLARYGYRVLAARTGPEALGLWRAHRNEIAVLLTDMVLPGGMSGANVIRELRAESPRLPVVVASGYTGGREAHLPTDVGLLAKPFEAHTLLTALRQALAAGAAPAP